MKPVRNAIVMMFDTLQHNYIGCYGNTWIKTPNFDRLSRESVLFENAYGNNMPTIPVRRSMLTGRITLHDVGWGPLRPQDITIADLLWGTGIETAMAYNSCPLFNDRNGYARSWAQTKFSHGYDNYFFIHDDLYHYTIDQFFEDPGYLDRIRSQPDGDFLEKATRQEMNGYLRDKQYWLEEDDHAVAVNIHEAIRMIESRDKRHGLMLWIDCWDPHEPIDPPSVWTPDMPCPYDPDYKGCDLWSCPPAIAERIYTEEQLHHLRMLYAEKITLCDKYFGKLIKCVMKEGMEENTLIWFTSDHGYPCGNGEHGHGLLGKCRPWPYEELVHIPLMIKFPGCKAGARIKTFVQDCDCAPTVLDWLGVPIPKNMTGKSLLPLCRGEVEKVRDFAVCGYYSFSWSIITEDWSYIHWLNKMENGTASECAQKIYVGHTHAEEYQNEQKAASSGVNEAYEEYLSQRSIDGAEQWTCTPSSKTDVPDTDELYDRKSDPFQLHNVIDEYPDIASQLMRQLIAYMKELSDFDNIK